MDEGCFRPLLCTVKAELGRGQPMLRRWSLMKAVWSCYINGQFNGG